jgi:DUF1680 family protein
VGPDGPALAVSVPATPAASDDPPPWPYAPDRPVPAVAAPAALRLIPFYARANRGPAAMRVFLPEHRDED